VRQSPAGKDVNTEAEDIFGFRYQAMASEDTEDFACAGVGSRARDLVRAL
jgi:hypothetical protein